MKRYIDTSDGLFRSILLLDEEGKQVELVPAGTSISRMPPSDWSEEYIRLDQQGFHFFFGDDLPPIDFYTVPKVDLFASDGKGGYWGTVGTTTDITDLEAPICYIDSERTVFQVAANLRSLFFPLKSAAERAKKCAPIAGITVFNSLAAAKEQYDFFEIDTISDENPE